MTELKKGLPPIPERFKALPIDERGFPVPWFVATVDGKPDFRVIRPGGIAIAHTRKTCWLCGAKLGQYKAFVIGCMCVVNRTISEPPSHLECARYAAIACPFLTKPAMKRNEKDLPAEAQEPAGNGLKRNPGVAVVWVTKDYTLFDARDGRGGVLFRLGDPSAVEWYREGRPATLEEANTAIAHGLPLLLDAAKEEGPKAVEHLARLVQRATKHLPEAAP